MLPRPIARIIAEYVAEWKMSSWFRDIEPKIKPTVGKGYMIPSFKDYHLSKNPNSDNILSEFNIDWRGLSENSASWALDLLEANQDKINWDAIIENPNPRAWKIVENNMDKITSTWYISANPNAIKYLRANPDIIDDIWIFANTNEEASNIIKEFNISMDKVSESTFIYSNPAQWAVDLLVTPKPYSDTERSYLTNTNPKIIEKLKADPELCYRNWNSICRNPKMIDMVRAHPEKIRECIYENPAIFELDIPAGLVDILVNI